MRSTAEGGDVVDVAPALIFAGCTAPRSTSPRTWTARQRGGCSWTVPRGEVSVHSPEAMRRTEIWPVDDGGIVGDLP
jgi:hypothetical protein